MILGSKERGSLGLRFQNLSRKPHKSHIKVGLKFSKPRRAADDNHKVNNGDAYLISVADAADVFRGEFFCHVEKF